MTSRYRYVVSNVPRQAITVAALLGIAAMSKFKVHSNDNINESELVLCTHNLLCEKIRLLSGLSKRPPDRQTISRAYDETVRANHPCVFSDLSCLLKSTETSTFTTKMRTRMSWANPRLEFLRSKPSVVHVVISVVCTSECNLCCAASTATLVKHGTRISAQVMMGFGFFVSFHPSSTMTERSTLLCVLHFFWDASNI
jgi:hypothetical protein